MLFTEINPVFFSNQQDAVPEATPYASLISTHHGINDLNEEITLLEAALKALDPEEKNDAYKPHRTLIGQGKELRQRYDAIRGNENMSFRDYLFHLHAYRISLTFARLDIAQTLSLFSFDQIVMILEAPVQALCFLSVALPGTRLLLNLLHVAQHVLDPSPDERQGLPSIYDRFYYELSLNFMQIMNDLIWTSANLFTNYPQILGLSTPVVNAILLICLTFDLASSVYAYDQNEKAFAEKSGKYREALAQLNTTDIDYVVISEELKQLELRYRGDKAKLEQFLTAGAVILLAFSLIASSAYPFFLPLGAALCVFGTALYLTAGQRGVCVNAPSPEHDEAYLSSLIKHTVYPLLFMVAAASVGWPVAILLAAPVMVYENKEAIEKLLEPAESMRPHSA
jgi:hypothetical protein